MGAGDAPFYPLGLIGYPLGHSLSPQLHHAALAQAGLRGEYRLYAIAPGATGNQEIAALLERLRSGELRGLNVTIPHKQAVMPFLDRLSTVARAVGAVNTIFDSADGLLHGENTDVPGFLRDVQQVTGGSLGRALVLGAGGSARAVVYALAQAGWQVHVLARRAEQAAALNADLSADSAFTGQLEAGGMETEDLRRAGQSCDLLVNTTPLGMHPNIQTCPWPEDLPLPEGAAVYDLVYNPLDTVLIQRARRAGLPAANGAGMLVAQAALAFSIWTGLEPPYDVMAQAMERAQAERHSSKS
jgi:shikimate dehydrogenase